MGEKLHRSRERETVDGWVWEQGAEENIWNLKKQELNSMLEKVA
jgi:hypothetical protein